MKKILSMILAFTLAFGAVTLPVAEGGITFTTGISASAEETSDGFEYEINDDDETVTITGYTGDKEDVKIPDEINGMKVTCIGNSAFFCCSSLKSIKIPDGVTSIEYCVFEGCSSLASVTLPNSVTSIGDNAFEGCSSLASIAIPDSITSIGYSAFSNCSSLTSITVDLNNKNYSSKDGVLFNKNKTELIQYPIGNTRKSYTIPDSVTSIGDYVFSYCSSLTSITISDGVTNIGIAAFLYCSSLTNVTIPDGVTSIGDWAFAGCSSLASIAIPDSITNIGGFAFSGCSSLKSIKIPDGVTSIEVCVFEDCSGLTSVIIPDSVTSIGNSAFKNTPWLANKQKINPLVVVNSILIDGTTASGKVVIPGTVKVINDYAFQGSYNEETESYESYVTSIIIPDSVTSIGDNAFEGCSSLKSIKIPDGVTSIGDCVFGDCSGLTSVIIPDSVTSIGDSAFSNCSGLTGITIPDSIEYIGYDAFYNCSSLKNVKIPDSVTSIGGWAFENCSGLTGITIPASVTHIEGYAFGYYCDESTNWEDTKIPGFKVKCYKNTAGYNYAADNGFDYELISEHTHSYTSKVTKQPTCTEEGIRTYTCSCGDTYTEKISAKGHKYTTKVVKPTCTAKGYTLHTCSVCKKSYKDNYTNALGHKYVKVKVVKPTLKSKGYTLYKCSRCGATVKKNVVPALVSLTKAKITGIKNTTYTGKQIKPVIKVVIGKTTLKKGRDYSVVYGKNKIGRAVVKIVGKGKYAGSVTKYFRILPRKTAAAVKSTVRGKISATVSKRSEATKYQIQLSSNSKFKGAKTYTVKLNKATLKGTSKKVYYVRVRTVYGNYASSWSAVKKVRVK